MRDFRLTGLALVLAALPLAGAGAQTATAISRHGHLKPAEAAETRSESARAGGIIFPAGGMTAEQLVAPFAAVCMAHLGDPAAQAATAQAAPWHYAASRTRQNGEQVYSRDAADLSIGGAGNGCSITTAMDPSVDLAKVRDALRAVVSLGEGQVSDTGDVMGWKIETNDTKRQYSIGLMVSVRSGRTLGTLLVQDGQSE